MAGEHSRFWKEGEENSKTIDDFLDWFEAEYPKRVGAVDTGDMCRESFQGVVDLEGGLRVAYDRYELSRRFPLGISKKTRERLGAITRARDSLEAKKRGMVAGLDNSYDIILEQIKMAVSQTNTEELKKVLAELRGTSELYHLFNEDKKAKRAEKLYTNASGVLDEWREKEAESIAAFNEAGNKLKKIKDSFSANRGLKELKRLRNELLEVHNFYLTHNDKNSEVQARSLLKDIDSEITSGLSAARRRRSSWLSSVSPKIEKALAVGALGCLAAFGAMSYDGINRNSHPETGIREAQAKNIIPPNPILRMGNIRAVSNDNRFSEIKNPAIDYIIYTDLDKNRTSLYKKNRNGFERLYEFPSSDAEKTDLPKKRAGPGTPEGFYRINGFMANAGEEWGNPMFGNYYYELSYPNSKDVRDACSMGLLSSSEMNRLLSYISKDIDPVKRHKNYNGHVSVNDSNYIEDDGAIKKGRDVSNCAVYLLTSDIERIHREVGNGSAALVILENSARPLKAADYTDVLNTF